MKLPVSKARGIRNKSLYSTVVLYGGLQIADKMTT